MPTYDYICTNCGYVDEILQKMTDLVLTLCPHCKKNTLKRKIGGGIGLQFQGTGFYSTDYQPKASTPEDITPPSSTDGIKKGCGCGKKTCDA